MLKSFHIFFSGNCNASAKLTNRLLHQVQHLGVLANLLICDARNFWWICLCLNTWPDLLLVPGGIKSMPCPSWEVSHISVTYNFVLILTSKDGISYSRKAPREAVFSHPKWKACSSVYLELPWDIYFSSDLLRNNLGINIGFYHIPFLWQLISRFHHFIS